MRYIEYRARNFTPASEDLIAKADQVITKYNADGYVLTLRQLYYQFVARGWLPNTERSYKNLGNVVNDARVAGRLPWDGIEDRGRDFNGWMINEDMRSVFDGIDRRFAVDLWDRQPYYVEAWIEKEALGNVLERPCSRYRVPYMSCKGYLSASAAWRAGERFEQHAANGQQCVLIHLGDHDPSGLDMTKDNGNRVELFSREANVDVRRVALNMDQVRRYNPPPNPAKLTDSRVGAYMAEHGQHSWELDALEPAVIDRLVQDEIESLIDWDIWNTGLKEEATARKFLKRFHREFFLIKTWMEDNHP